MKSWVISDGILELQDGSSRFSVTADEIYSTVIERESRWTDVNIGRTGAAASIEFSPYPATLRAELHDDTEGRLPALQFCIRTQDGETHPVPPEAVRRGHIVAGSVWYPIEQHSTDAMLDLLARANVSTETFRPTTLRGLLVLKAEAAAHGIVTDHMMTGGDSAIRFAGRSAHSPAGVNARLYPYQLDGWRWLKFVVREQLGGLLADEMGLGKTLQVISLLRDQGNSARIPGALVVCPGSLLENWRRELEKFAPDLSVLKHQGSLRTGRPADLAGHDVVLTSYDTAVRDLSLLKMRDWSVVILDEAQNIKNPEALRTRSVKQIPRRAGLAMTGTPVENRLTDLWSILDFAVPGYLGTIEEFRGHYDNDVDAASRLEPLVSPLMLRRRVAEVARDLPDRIDVPEFLELSEEEATEYDRIRNDILTKYGKAATLVSLTLLRQFCAHPELLDDAGPSVGKVAFTKFERLKEILAEIVASGEKVLVFTSYTAMADRIARAVEDELAVFAATLDGRLAIDERQPLIDRFSAVHGPAVLVLNPKAGGSGLNITAANHVIHYNLEWNPALEDQASARAYRRGQNRPVTVRRLICAGTVEEIVNDRVERKRQLSDAAVIGVAGEDQDYADVLAALQQSPGRRT